MNSRRSELFENIEKYLRQNIAVAIDCCGEGDDVVYLPARKALDDFLELRKMIEEESK